MLYGDDPGRVASEEQVHPHQKTNKPLSKYWTPVIYIGLPFTWYSLAILKLLLNILGKINNFSMDSGLDNILSMLNFLILVTLLRLNKRLPLF